TNLGTRSTSTNVNQKAFVNQKHINPMPDNKLSQQQPDVNQKHIYSMPVSQLTQQQSIEDITNDTPLPMMPPLRYRVGAEYSFGSSWVGGTLRYITTQNRVVPEEDPTTGYTLLAIQACHRIDRAGLHRFGLRAENVLNTTYRDHL